MTATLTSAQFRALKVLAQCATAGTTRGESLIDGYVSPRVNSTAAKALMGLGLARWVVEITPDGRKALELYPE